MPPSPSGSLKLSGEKGVVVAVSSIVGVAAVPAIAGASFTSVTVTVIVWSSSWPVPSGRADRDGCRTGVVVVDRRASSHGDRAVFVLSIGERSARVAG
ncbi:MAG: hypothetical protein U5O15_11045 [Candidatus Krumholzibacteriota bacterium]|nr:hypothetical protein [Candidatus Krumholzibacteriota bacterium]